MLLILSFALHFSDGQQLTHMCCTWPLVSAPLLAVVLLSLPCKGCSVVLSHQSVQYCLALPFLSALGVGVDDWIKANEVGPQLWSSTDALVLPWAITDALVRADLHYSSGFS